MSLPVIEIPTRLRIANVTVETKMFENTDARSMAMGRSFTKHADIRICSDMPYETQVITYFHEMVHFILASYSIRVDEENLEELIASAIGNELASIIPQIVVNKQ